MARYKHYDYSQMKLLPVSFEQQIACRGAPLNANVVRWPRNAVR